MKIVKGVPPGLARERPLTRGPHTIAELARLVAAGRTLKEIAVLWDLRPIAGPDDLHVDVMHAWEEAGEPGGAERPAGHGRAYDLAWAVWRGARVRAIEAWLKTFVEGAPHCETCSCYTAAQAQPCPEPAVGHGC
jgi:hypothetical protein